jgi:hypothetical protein
MSILNSNFKLKLKSTFKLDLELRIELNMNLSQRDPHSTQRVLDFNDIVTACSGARNSKTASFKHGG